MKIETKTESNIVPLKLK